MSYGERLARLLYVLCWIGILAGLAALGRSVAVGGPPFAARPDPETGTAGLLVETDRGTGCDYIVTPWGGIVPRTGADGRQLCRPRS